jgi:adenylate cyclase
VSRRRSRSTSGASTRSGSSPPTGEVEKRRYLVPAGDRLSIELDVYTGELDGLVTAEIEFDSEGQAEAFEPPPWIGSDVTGDAGYSNQSLAAHGRPLG